MDEYNICQSDLKRLISVLHSARLGVWDWYITTNRVALNSDWKSMLGYGDDEVSDTLDSWSRLIHPDDNTRVMAELEKHLSGRTEHYESEHRLLHKNGNFIWVLDTGKVVEYTGDGKPYRATGIHQNITMRKDLEIGLKRALEAKDIFMASISHDINNLLNCISLPGQIIRIRDTDLLFTDQVTMILKSVDSLSTLIKDIMDYVKFGHTDLRLDRSLEDIVALVEDCTDVLRPLSDSKGMTVAVNFEGDTCLVEVDRNRFKQVMTNLISNSIKYGKQGGYVKVEISNDAIAASGVLNIMVSDNGCGMSESVRSRLFNPFERGSNGHGYGLGMCIVEKIIKLMGGAVEVWSEEDVGTNVMLTIPIPRTGLEKQRYSPKRLVRDIKAIYAEDNDTHYDMLRTALPDMRFIRACDGRHLVNLALSVPHDIIITDISMPILSGCEATRELRDIGYSRPIIAVTGNVYRDEVAGYYAAGISKVISKPYSVETLVNTINSLILEVEEDYQEVSCPPPTSNGPPHHT